MTDASTQERLARLLHYRAQDPSNFLLAVDTAALHLALGQIAEARTVAEEAIALSPDMPQGYALLGLGAMHDHRYEAAVAALEHAIRLGDDAPAVLYHHAYALTLLGRFADARESAAAAAKFAAEYPFAPALYIRVLHHLGEVEAAIAYGEELGAAGVSAPRVQGMLSTLYMDDENFEKARAAAQAALASDDNDLDAHTTAGLLALGDLDGRVAAAAFERVLAVQGDNGRAMLGHGLGQMLGGDLKSATEIFRQTVRTTHMREHLGSWQALAWCQVLQKDADGAERTLQEALEIDRTFSETHGMLAVVALMRGDVETATQAIKRANGLDRENYSGEFAQSVLEGMSGNPEEARQLMDHMLTRATLPDGRTVQSAIAEMLAQNAAGVGDRIH